MNKVDLVLVGRHPLVVLCDRTQNLPRRSLVPSWNFSVVLAACIEKPFEPLHQAMPRDLMFKLFLLAATSTRRVSEIHAFCIVPPPFLIQNPRSFCLAPNPVFLPKISMEVALSLDLKITTFYPEPTSPLEQGFHLCDQSVLCVFM